MERKNKVEDIHLEIYDLIPFTNQNHVGFIIQWDSDIGFGEYTIYRHVDSGKWFGDSECMDNNEDKEFIKELMKIFIEKLTIK